MSINTLSPILAPDCVLVPEIQNADVSGMSSLFQLYDELNKEMDSDFQTQFHLSFENRLVQARHIAINKFFENPENLSLVDEVAQWSLPNLAGGYIGVSLLRKDSVGMDVYVQVLREVTSAKIMVETRVRQLVFLVKPYFQGDDLRKVATFSR